MSPKKIEEAKMLLKRQQIAIPDENLFEFSKEKEMLQTLLQMGVNPNEFDTYFKVPILALAFSRIDYARFKLLLDLGANPNVVSSTDATGAEIIFEMLASYPSRIRFLDCLLKHKVNLNILHPQTGETLLSWRMKFSYSTQLIELLLKYGASPNFPNAKGLTLFDEINKGMITVKQDVLALLNAYK